MSVTAAAPGPAAAACGNRGDLDARYCDMDRDLVADTPRDPDRWLAPDPIVFSTVPSGAAAADADAFAAFMGHLAEKTGRRVVWRDVESDADQLRALREGRLHVSGVAARRTVAAVNRAGFVPVAVVGRTDGTFGYTVQLIARNGSGITGIADLKGRKVAHVTPSSFSGDQVPRALFGARGVVPGRDYAIVFSGRHANSILGVLHADYDAAPVASIVLARLRAAGTVEGGALRVVWESKPFPGTAFGYVHSLSPDLQDKIADAFRSFPLKGTPLAAALGGDAAGFVPVAYADDWSDVRAVERAAAGAPRAR